MSETKIDSQEQKPKVSKLAIAALVFGAVSLCTLAMVGFRGWCGYMSLSYIVGLITLRFSAVVGFVLGIVAFLRIAVKGSKVMKGRGFAIAGMLAAVASFTLGALGLAPRQAPPSPGMWCSTNLSGIGKAMKIYASEFDGKYPTVDKWCDLLIVYSEVDPKMLVCKGSDAKIGESSYAINKNLAGKEVSEVPADVVLLFETDSGKNPLGRQEQLGNREFYKTLSQYKINAGLLKRCRASEKVYKLRWNQFGGPEILTLENHKGEGCSVLFNDGHVEFVRAKRIGELKWE